MQQPTRLEARIDRRARRILAGAPSAGLRGFAVECAVFLAKQAWACVFGALLLLAIVLVRTLIPADAGLSRNDVLTVVALAIQAGMLLAGLESGREV